MTLPTTSPRIFAIDSLRGFALAGVALVHMVEQYIAGPPPKGFIDMESFMWVDYLAMGITGIFIQGKFFALFSILFGLSFSLQMDNAAKISSGSLQEVFTWNAGYGMKTKMDFQVGFSGRFYLTFGYFLLGLWIGKMGTRRR